VLASVLAAPDVATFASPVVPRPTCPLHGGYLPCVFGAHCTAPAHGAAAAEAAVTEAKAEAERELRQLNPATLVSLVGKLVSPRGPPYY